MELTNYINYAIKSLLKNLSKRVTLAGEIFIASLVVVKPLYELESLAISMQLFIKILTKIYEIKNIVKDNKDLL